MGAAALTLALNISSSKRLCDALDCKYLDSLKHQNPLDWWNTTITELSKVSIPNVQSVYKSLVKMLDKEILKGKLQLDNSIWIQDNQVQRVFQ